jgi:hypothetical protein
MLSLVFASLLVCQNNEAKIDLPYVNRQMNLMIQDQRVWFAITLAHESYRDSDFDEWSDRYISNKDRSIEYANKVRGKLWDGWVKSHNINTESITFSPCFIAIQSIDAAIYRVQWLEPRYKSPDENDTYSDNIWRITTEIIEWTRDNNPCITHGQVMEMARDARKWKDKYRYRVKV